MSAARLIISGRVQGVGFRWWAVEVAHQLGLRGWVRNRRDGTVELLAIGEPAAIDQMAAACRRGPLAARVTEVTRHEGEDDGAVGFEHRGTV